MSVIESDRSGTWSSQSVPHPRAASAHTAALPYRADIDGLRAIAVLPVILYHAGFDFLRGGFAGVDIFFVISGFLITSILLREMQEGSFTLERFYIRRAKRILPALVLVLLVSTAFALLLLPSSALMDFGDAMLGVALFSSNHVFWAQADYFSPSSETSPLLHTWSLAVEEQFYLVLPFILLFSFRFLKCEGGQGGLRAVGLVLVVLTLASLALTFAFASANPMTAFYLLPFRAWELLAGSLCAWAMIRMPVRPNAWLAGLGLALILSSLLWLDSHSLQRSQHLVFPVLGACLVVLFSGPGTWVHGLLSRPLLVGIGLISYSAYLWHQPVFAFARIVSLDEPSTLLMLGLSALTLGLAWLTWRFVEGPMRKADWGGHVLPRAGLASAGVACAGFFLMATQGLPARLNASQMAAETAALDVNPLRVHCHVMHSEPLPQHPLSACGTPDSQGNFDVLLIGDSHADALGGALSEVLTARGLSVYTVTHSDCTGLPGLRQLNKADATRCDRYARDLLSFAESRAVHTVILMSRLSVHDSANGFDNGEGGVEHLREGCNGSLPMELSAMPCADEARQSAFRTRAAEELAQLAQNVRLILVYPVPEVGWHVPERLFKSARFGGEDTEISTDFARYSARHQPVFDLLDAVQGRDVRRIYPHEILCDPEGNGRCIATQSGRISYYDDDHLSHSGARPIAEAIAAAMPDTQAR